MPSLRRLFVLTTIVLLVSAPSASAQAPRPAGVVTTLEGNVTAIRVATPAPVQLRFKDDVFYQDRITTAEQSLARVLLDGKAVVTVRERSVLTITQAPGRATIALENGKFALAVAREKMQPGDRIEIRTPNAVAGVRGTVVVTETQGSPALPPTLQTDMYLLQGTLEDVNAVDPATQGLIGAPRTLNVLEQFRVVGVAPGTVSPIRQDQLGAIRAGLQPRGGRPQAPPDTAQAMVTATALAGLLNGAGDPLGVLKRPLFPTQAGTPALGESDPNPTLAATGFSSALSPGGQNVAELALPRVTPSPGVKGVNLIGNGGFESGFAGWTVVNEVGGSGDFFINSGTVAPLSSNTVPGAPQGSHVALTDQTGPGAHFLYRDITVPTGTPTLQFRLFIGNRHTAFVTPPSLSFSGSANQQARVDIMNPSAPIDDVGSGVLRNLFQTNVGDPLVSNGYTTYSFSLDDFEGQTVRLRFAEVDNQLFFQLGVDDVVLMDDGPLTLRAGSRFTSGDPLLIAADTTLTTPGAVFGVHDGSALTSQTTEAFAQLTNTSLTSGRFLHVAGLDGADGATFASVKLRGPLLIFTTTGGSALTLPDGLVGVFEGGRVTVEGSTAPLAAISGGTHSIATTPGRAMIDLRGRTGATAGEVVDGTLLTLGTDQPLLHGGSLLDLAAAAVNGHTAFRIDTALLEASLPALINLRKGSLLTTQGVAAELSERAKVTGLGALFRLDNSTLAVATGAAVNVARGSVLEVRGDLIRLANRSTLSLLNGPVLIVSGGSLARIGGALIAFGGLSGNAVNVANSLCNPCQLLGGIPVALTGGAIASNVHVTGAVTGAGLGSVRLSNPTLLPGGTALVLVSGATSKLSIGAR